jgi:hypothetical protein
MITQKQYNRDAGQQSTMKTGKTLEDGWKRSYQKQNYGLKIYLEVIARLW